MRRKRLIAVSVIAFAVILVIGTMGLWNGKASTESKVGGEAVAYVLKVGGHWQLDGGQGEVKPGEELHVGETLTPEHADKQNVLTIYEYGKGPSTISGEQGAHHIVQASTAAPNATDRLATLLPRVNEVFAESTISRGDGDAGDKDRPLPGPLLLSDRSVDLSPLRSVPANESDRPHRVVLRFLSVPVKKHSPAGAPTKDAAKLEYPCVWDAAKLGLVQTTPDLKPGLYRLQVWTAPRKGTAIPAADSDAFPDSEFLVVLVAGDQNHQEAVREYDSVMQRMQHDWDKTVAADIKLSFARACLLQIAERQASTAAKN